MDRANFNFLEMDDEERYCTDDGPFTGEAFLLHPDEAVAWTRQYKNGYADGPGREFHPNGNLAAEGEWSHGAQVGVHRQWYEDGTLKTEANYTGGMPRVKRFNPDGTPANRRAREG